MSMSKKNRFKRVCDEKISGCGEERDRNDVVAVKRGKLHLCKKCAGSLIWLSLREEGWE